MKFKIVIPGELPTLNEIIDQSKAHFAVYANTKQTFDNLVGFSCAGVPRGRITKRADFAFVWYRSDRRTDPDNITAGQKFVFDGLVSAGVLRGDGWRYVRSIKHDFKVDKQNPRVEIVITEVE